ncbi:uncharacterized protein LOC129590720 [Paramacrobiotus metropolitanus]|uniref:uncharacterized protein LOC129590720 n=1 Tax=Paramacrobiotus metropolitanus TaxID=2943436 RepID=UPI002445D9C0|nr:uncharacterized protein LOC129590720 [Paramacrobiotus metropolitanus]
MGINASNTADTVQHFGCTMQYRYSHADLIGKGSYGAVYKARVVKRGDYLGGNLVAVKVMQICIPRENSDPESLLKVAQRLKKITELTHENLVAYHKVSIIKASIGATVELAMNYHEGDLRLFLSEAQQNKNLLNSYKKLAQYVACIARGLDFLHQNGIIHGDLKPENILVDVAEDGRKTLLISDLDDIIQMRESATCSADITQLRGTPRYMSPEMLKKFAQQATETPGPMTDLWSFGCIILEMNQVLSCLQKDNYNIKWPQTRLVKDGIIVWDFLTDAQYVVKIIDGYVPFVSNDNALYLSDLIQKCLQPIASNRIALKQVLKELRIKHLIAFFFFPYGSQLILFDPATHSLYTLKRVPIRSRFVGFAVVSRRQTAEKEIVFFQRLRHPNGRIVKLRLWNVGEGTWREITPPEDVRLDQRLMVVNGKCYFWDHNGHFTVMDTYTGGIVSRNSSNAEISADFSLSAVAICGERIFCATPSSLHRYDTVRDEWQSLQKLPNRRTDFAMAVVNGYVYIMGGLMDAAVSSASADCIRVDVERGTWEAIASLQQPRYRHAACVIKDRIYICGGSHSTKAHALTIEFYDTKANVEWLTVNLSEKDIDLLDVASKCSHPWEVINAMSIWLDGDVAPDAQITQ